MSAIQCALLKSLSTSTTYIKDELIGMQTDVVWIDELYGIIKQTLMHQPPMLLQVQFCKESQT